MYNPQSDTHEYAAEEGAWPEDQGKPVLIMVLKDLVKRSEQGFKKYQNEYCVNTRENPLWEAYEEALDLVMYLRAEIEQRNNE